jgi:hypothetical protein
MICPNEKTEKAGRGSRLVKAGKKGLLRQKEGCWQRHKKTASRDWKGRLTESVKEGLPRLACNCATKRSELPIHLYMTSTA